MSQTGPSSAAHLTDAYPLNLTVVVLLLLPCVLLLLLLNCFFLVYKLLILIKRRRRRREDTEEVLLRSTLPRVRLSDAVFSPLQDAGRAYMSVSEPVLPHPVTSSRASSRERLGVNHRVRVRLLRPDGATGSGSLRAPSSIRAASSAFTPRLEAPWSRSAPVLTQSSCSETETRINLVPPNSPTMEHIGHIRRSSTREKLSESAVHPFDKVMAECEFTDPMTDMSCLNTTTVGPGLDSDFGASAGVSLRILSADSDGLSNGVLASALEWDYYDPCYVKQNNIPKHKHPMPAIHTRQYWV